MASLNVMDLAGKEVLVPVSGRATVSGWAMESEMGSVVELGSGLGSAMGGCIPNPRQCLQAFLFSFSVGCWLRVFTRTPLKAPRA